MARVRTDQTTTVVEATRLVRLSYLQTIAALDNSTVLGNLAGETSGNNTNFSSTDPGSPGFLGIGGEGSSTLSQSFTDTGWSISRTWLETWWDKIRWAIGIREIGIYSYEYAQTSEIVSVPFLSPREILKVSLRVNEQVPRLYPNTQSWIQYFVSGDGGKNWHRINPLDKPSVFTGESGKPLPRIINFNADFASENSDENKFITVEEPVKSIKFRAVLTRPGGEEYEGTSPVLKGYRLMIYPKGGLQ
jgi:hypothetical protein